MQDNIFNAFNEQAKGMYAPVSKFNGLMVESLEKMTEFQLNAVKAYAEIFLGQMKKAADVKDVDSLRSLSSSQAETAATINKKVIEDAKALSEMAVEFKTQVESILEESRAAATSAATPKSAPKAAAKATA